MFPVAVRYAGYCPQLKYNVGKSYGQLTAELLSSPEVKHSHHLVLHTGHDPSTESEAGLTLRSISDSNLKKMIPGYTGRCHTLTQAGANKVTEHLMENYFILGTNRNTKFGNV